MNQFLPPRLLQAVGLVLLIAFGVFWAVTSRESALLVGAAMTLITIGFVADAGRAIRDLARPTDRPKDRAS